MHNVLHITHSWGGGIVTYIEDLEKASKGFYKIYILKCWHGMVNLEYKVDGRKVEKKYFLGKEIKLTDFECHKYAQILSLVLDEFHIDIVHIDSSLGHPFDLFRVPPVKNIPIVCTIHDFLYICPSFHLVDTKGSYCGICNRGKEKNNCLEKHEYLYSEFSVNNLIEWRRKFESAISNIDIFVFPSESTKKIFTSFYNIESNLCRVINHGTSLIKCEEINSSDPNTFRVGILGSMLKHKGKFLIESVIRSLENYTIEFFHFGDGNLSGPNLVNLGVYNQNNILSLLKAYQIDIILLLSTWPETFSYTLSESIAANIPPIVTNFGALNERVEKDNIGWIVDDKDADGISNLILRLSKTASEVEYFKKRISDIKLKSLSEMNQEYVRLYDYLMSETKKKIPNNLIAYWEVGPDESFIRDYFWKNFRIIVIKFHSIFFQIKTKIRNYLK